MSVSATHPYPPTLTLSLFLIFALAAVFIAAGLPAIPIVALGSAVAFLFAFLFPESLLYLGIALTPFLGLALSIPTGRFLFGERAFGGSIDFSLAEGILFFVLLGWAVRLIVRWMRGEDRVSELRAPLLAAVLLLVGAHVASLFSPLLPDTMHVLKFSLRPVLYMYLAFVLLPVNLLSTRQRLLNAVMTIALVGLFAALTGFIALFFGGSGGFPRATPLTIFGVSALGQNHNELAELLVFTTFASLAAAELVKDERARALLRFVGLFQGLIGLLAFTRAGWLTFAAQLVFIAFTIGREVLRRYIRPLFIACLLLLPLAGAMAAYTLSEAAQSSTSTRIMMSEIAIQLFRSSPWFGAGAGTFLERVGSTSVFLLEYGSPLESHGILQKIGAETGLFGLVALGVLYTQFGWLVARGARAIHARRARRAFFFLCAGACGALFYQLFNTAYWSGKMWLPIGLALTAALTLRESSRGSFSIK